MHKLWINGIIFSFFTAFAAGIHAATPIKNAFYGIKAPVSQSVLFVRTKDGKTLFETDATKTLVPASVTKIVTSAAALAYFSPGHTFHTRIFHDGKRSGDTIQGNLILVGDGDPFLINEKLWQLAADIGHLGIKRITGDLVIDNSLFDNEWRDESRAGTAYASSHAYDAPITAAGVNFNTFAVAVAPGDTVGSPARVNTDPYALPGLEIINRLKTGPKGSSKRVLLSRMSKLGKPQLILNGSLPLGSGVSKYYRSVEDPVWSAGEQLRAFLAAGGIRLEGKVREGTLSKNTSLLHTVESYDLAYMVKGLNHFSNNYIADVVLKRLGAAFPSRGPKDGKGQGTLANGEAVLSRFLKEEVGIKTPFQLENGSGLDVNNKLSAAQIVQILTYMEKRFDLFPDFIASLPASGVDGTLGRRFGDAKTRSLQGKIRAKTGTLSEPISVAGLAGYCHHPDHGLIAFAIIENGMTGKAQPSILDLRQRQDRALKVILESL